MSSPVFIALLHHPMVNRSGEVITTSVTNLDIHDIARSARTYGVEQFFIVTPLEEQQTVVQRILAHWQSDSSAEAHPDRVEALKRVRLVSEFEQVIAEIQTKWEKRPEVVLTDAAKAPKLTSYDTLSLEIAEERPIADSEVGTKPLARPRVIVFGTGWGVAPEFLKQVDRRLEPIEGAFDRENQEHYNHLSVRSAVAITLDRLLGEASAGRKKRTRRLQQLRENEILV